LGSLKEEEEERLRLLSDSIRKAPKEGAYWSRISCTKKILCLGW